jgi:hypothetical protein
VLVGDDVELVEPVGDVDPVAPLREQVDRGRAVQGEGGLVDGLLEIGVALVEHEEHLDHRRVAALEGGGGARRARGTGSARGNAKYSWRCR